VDCSETDEASTTRSSLLEDSGAAESDPLQRDDSSALIPIEDLGARERFWLVASLFIPLITVYAADYACQASAWTAIGFLTVDLVHARAEFYQQSNWLYQAGSFVARSSGMVLPVISLPIL
jgi:hypothetical protein